MLRVRIFGISFFFVLMFAGAVIRLADLQFNRSSEFAAYRDSRLSHIEQKAPRRGRILDADGKIIAEDRPTQDLWLTPARQVRIGGRRTIVSNLEPVGIEQLVVLAGAKGGERVFERSLAVTALVEGNPLVAALSRRLNRDKTELAEKLLAATVAGRPDSRDDLLQPRLAIEDIDFSLALEIRSARANPYGDEEWGAVEIRTGGKRFYPAGQLLGHLTGTVGKLTAEEYVELRGRWGEDDRVPGSGRIVKQGRVFFSILANADGENLSDEELIIRLREIRRSGRMIKTQGYFANENVGRGGLEQHYNQYLRGRHRLQSLRLARDEKTGRRRFEPKGDVASAVDGLDIRLSLRLDIQRQAHEIMARHMKDVAERLKREHNIDWTPSGVAIMMDPRNGRIFAMVSLPTYDPNTFNRDFAALEADPAKPLVDRALAGIYPPGSVVKPLVGLASLSEGKTVPGQKFYCDKVLMLGGARFTCLGRHGDQDLESALMHSCNIFFYHAGEALGGRSLYEWYLRMGLGRRTGVDVSGESSGLMPRNAYTRRGWATGNTYHMAIGQGIAVTPLQIAVAYCALANAQNGVMRIVKPHFLLPPLRSPETPEGESLAREAMLLDQPAAEIMVDREALAIVRQGMWEVVQGRPETGERGSGGRASFPLPGGGFLMELAGKSGTAEWSRLVRGLERKQVSHVWFATYAPFDRPEVVVVVLLPEAGGGGGGTCAPIAKDLLRMWFNLPERLENKGSEEGVLG